MERCFWEVKDVLKVQKKRHLRYMRRGRFCMQRDFEKCVELLFYQQALRELLLQRTKAGSLFTITCSLSFQTCSAHPWTLQNVHRERKERTRECRTKSKAERERCRVLITKENVITADGMMANETHIPDGSLCTACTKHHKNPLFPSTAIKNEIQNWEMPTSKIPIHPKHPYSIFLGYHFQNGLCAPVVGLNLLFESARWSQKSEFSWQLASSFGFYEELLSDEVW